jgi:hypothetical protein
MGYVGRLIKHPIRQQLHKLDGMRLTGPGSYQNRITDSKSTSDAAPLVDVFARSKYALVPPGDHLHSTHFSEAVCSGGVPVLLHSSDAPERRGLKWHGLCHSMEACRWRPPHEDSLPFAGYGVTYGLSVANVSMLDPELRKISDSQWRRLRHAAQRACWFYFRTTAVTLERMLSHFTAMPAAEQSQPQIDVTHTSRRLREQGLRPGLPTASLEGGEVVQHSTDHWQRSVFRGLAFGFEERSWRLPCRRGESTERCRKRVGAPDRRDTMGYTPMTNNAVGRLVTPYPLSSAIFSSIRRKPARPQSHSPTSILSVRASPCMISTWRFCTADRLSASETRSGSQLTWGQRAASVACTGQHAWPTRSSRTHPRKSPISPSV